jgi:hypothetical protein
VSDDVAALLEGVTSGLQDTFERLRDVVRAAIPDAVEEVDLTARLLGYTDQPGTYRGLIVAIALHRAHVNLMFAEGVALLELDSAGLLRGTGKKARHIRFVKASDVQRPEVRELIIEAARR